MAFLFFRGVNELHPDRQIIYQTAIQRLVNQALEEKETQFAAEHAADTNVQLLQYLRECAKTLGHTPYPKEIIGGKYILDRFETWENALRSANLPRPTTANKVSTFALVIEETKRQEEAYRQKKVMKKQKHQQRLQAQKKKREQNRQSDASPASD